MKWISVSNELPEIITYTCLVTDGNLIRVARYDKDKGYWKNTSSSVLDISPRVKFWINITDVPLP